MSYLFLRIFVRVPACLAVLVVLGFDVAVADTPEGFTAIFNGKDLTGWYGNDPHRTARSSETRSAAIASQQQEFQAHWSAGEGELINDGHGPFATTDAEYGDIELLVDYKTVAKADSGIYLRGAPQVQIWDYTEGGGKWDRGSDKGSGGLFNNRANSAGKNPRVLADKPFGEWNRFRIIQIGSRTTVYLNDQLVVDNAIMENFWDKDRRIPLARRGAIHLQTHGGEIRWKNLYAREIPIDEANARLRGDDAALGFSPAFNGKNLEGWAGAVDDYQVLDGSIVCREGRGGVLFTRQEYGDFVARVEFKLAEGGNNGLAIRYPGAGNPAYDGMTELQVLDDDADKYAKLDERQYHGSSYGMVPAHRGFLRQTGEWNYQEVTVHGSTIKVELNGTIILDADVAGVSEFMADSPHPGRDLKKGHFGFAGHNDPVMFRNISIRSL
jgi:hypothetical protein